jgi:hypothetical protein
VDIARTACAHDPHLDAPKLRTPISLVDDEKSPASLLAGMDEATRKLASATR